MTPFVESLLVLAVILTASLAGMFIGRVLPKHHLGDSTRTHFAAAISVVATLTALVLGLAISNANTIRLTMISDLALLSSSITRTNDMLRHYGPGAEAAQADLQAFAVEKLEDLFPQVAGARPDLASPKTAAILDRLQDHLLALRPQNDAQRWDQAQALALYNQIETARWVIAEQEHAVFPPALVIVISLWLSVLFVSYGLFMPQHATAILALVLSAAAVASAILLILEARTPFNGLIHIPSGSLVAAVKSLQP